MGKESIIRIKRVSLSKIFSLSAIKNLYRKHKRAFVAVVALLVALDILVLVYLLLSPGSFTGNSYKFISYNRWIELPDTSNYTYEKGADEEEAASMLFSKLVNQTEYVKTPRKQLEAEEKRLKKQYTKMAESNNMSYSDLLFAMGVDSKEWNRQVRESSKQTVKSKLVAYSYASKHKIKTSDKQYKAFCKDELEKIGYSEDEFEDAFSQSYDDYCKDTDMYSEYIISAVEESLYKEASPAKKLPVSSKEKKESKDSSN